MGMKRREERRNEGEPSTKRGGRGTMEMRGDYVRLDGRRRSTGDVIMREVRISKEEVA